jgi:hypothetical protein
LNALHEFSKLTSPNITINDIPTLYRDLQNENLENEAENIAIFSEALEPPPLSETQSINKEVSDPIIHNPLNADINVSNILPEGSRRVRFNLPLFSRK